MKEALPLDSPVETVIEKQVKKQTKLIASMRIIPGLKLWSFNTKTYELQEVKPETKWYELISKTVKKETEFNPDCFYIQALNLENASKKVMKRLKPAL